MNSQSQNAVAGPSSTRISPPLISPSPLQAANAINPTNAPQQSSTPVIFLSPLAPPSVPTFLASTQDLLARFHLLSAYDKYVRPPPAPHDAGEDAVPSTAGVFDKGKGKERDVVASSPIVGQTPTADTFDGVDDGGGGGKGEKRKKNNYKHLIKGVPGKHSMKKDDYLTTMIQVPPKQRMSIAPFDARTQQEAFTVSLEGLKGWNPSTLIQESAQAREDRKKRKELKALAKAQMLAAQTGTPAPLPSTPSASSVPASHPGLHQPQPQRQTSGALPASVPTAARPNTGTPRPGQASTSVRPGSTVPQPGGARPVLSVQPVQPGQRAGTPLRSATTATPVSAHPTGYNANFPPSSVAGAQGISNQSRGKKRERDDSVTGVNGAQIGIGTGGAVETNRHSVGGGVNGVGSVGVGSGNAVHPGGVFTNGPGNPNITNVPKVVVGAKAGLPGVRPRPVKKQRMDVQGQAREVTTVQQQPTPQGV